MSAYEFGASLYKVLVLLVPQALEDLNHGAGDGVDHFMVMVVEGHLNIQTHKLSQVTVGVGVLRPENWKDLKPVCKSQRVEGEETGQVSDLKQFVIQDL